MAGCGQSSLVRVFYGVGHPPLSHLRRFHFRGTPSSWRRIKWDQMAQNGPGSNGSTFSGRLGTNVLLPEELQDG